MGWEEEELSLTLSELLPHPTNPCQLWDCAPSLCTAFGITLSGYHFYCCPAPGGCLGHQSCQKLMVSIELFHLFSCLCPAFPSLLQQPECPQNERISSQTSHRLERGKFGVVEGEDSQGTFRVHCWEKTTFQLPEPRGWL